MKAVNLIPSDQRRGSAASARGTHALLAGLVILLLGVTAYVVTTNQIATRKTQLATAEQRNSTVTAQLSLLQPYVTFASLKDSRAQTVHDLAAARFDWQRAMRDLSRVTTHHVWLTGMTGTVAPGVDVDGGGGTTSELRSALPNPAVELQGCAVSNNAVVNYLSRLRAIKDVVRVSLESAQKPAGSDSASSSQTSGDASATGCGSGANTPAFAAVVFFAPIADATSAAATSTAGGTTSTTSDTSGSTP